MEFESKIAMRRVSEIPILDKKPFSFPGGNGRSIDQQFVVFSPFKRYVQLGPMLEKIRIESSSYTTFNSFTMILVITWCATKQVINYFPVL